MHVLRDERTILIETDDWSLLHRIDRENVATAESAAVEMEKLRQFAWADAEICTRVEGLLHAWLNPPQIDPAVLQSPEFLRMKEDTKRIEARLAWTPALSEAFGFSDRHFTLDARDETGRIASRMHASSVLWIAMVRVAFASGWKAEHPESFYWPPCRQIISKADCLSLRSVLFESVKDRTENKTSSVTSSVLLKGSVEDWKELLTVCDRFHLEMTLKELAKAPIRLNSIDNTDWETWKDSEML